MNSCEGLQLTITITSSNPTNLGYFKCGGLLSCAGLRVTITAPPPAPGTTGATIQSIQCTGGSCDGAFFILTNIQVLSCIDCPFNLFDPYWVPPPNAGILLSQIAKLECNPPDGCFQNTYTIINPLNAFEVICPAVSTCQAADINIIYLAQSSVTLFKSIICSADLSCQDLGVSIDNLSSSRIIIETITCSTSRSCGGLTINTPTTGTGACVQQIICGSDPSSCFG